MECDSRIVPKGRDNSLSLTTGEASGSNAQSFVPGLQQKWHLKNRQRSPAIPSWPREFFVQAIDRAIFFLPS